MNTLCMLRNGKSALRQIRSQLRVGVLTPHELDRLLTVAEVAFARVIPDPSSRPAQDLEPALEAHPIGPHGRLEVIRGDRP